MNTSEDVKAGAELNALVAERVMGWTLEMQSDGICGARDADGHFRMWSPDYMSNFSNYWSPSTSIADAWDVLLQVGGGKIDGPLYEMVKDKEPDEWPTVWHVELHDLQIKMERAGFDESKCEPPTRAEADTAPLAICRAALLTVTPTTKDQPNDSQK